MNRRHFIVKGLAGGATVGTGIIACRAQSNQPRSTNKQAQPEFTGRAHLDPKLIYEFVAAGHNDLPRVKQMLAEESAAQRRLGGLVLAERELGLGDLETALGGASHMGNREIALYLLAHGARIDAFCAAMLGYRDVVQALLKTVPETATTKGPHGYTLLYHAAISADIKMAEDISSLLHDSANDFNQALTSAARQGHVDMTRWLLENGVMDPNTKDGVGNTALMYAIKGNFPDVVTVLRDNGAM